MASRSDFREFSREDRYRAMEVLLQWEGACNASRLSTLFNVRRENVSRHVQDYRTAFPNQMDYDSRGKTFRPTTAFRPRFSRGVISEYLDLARRFYVDDEAAAWLDCGPRPHIEPAPEVFRGLVEAINGRRRISISYRSWNHPNGRERLIHPHALAYSGLRWHCRAFDEETESYRDFHLGRFDALGVVDTAQDAVTGDEDHDWNEYIDLFLVPNPDLTADEQALVKADYGMALGFKRVPARRAMAHYVLQSYQVQISGPLPDNPRERPLVCGNLEDVRGALF